MVRRVRDGTLTGSGRTALPVSKGRAHRKRAPFGIVRRDIARFTTGISEIVLIVDDVLEAARFYREVVGLEPESEANEDWAWFFAGEPGVPQRVALHRGKLGFEEHSPLPEGERFGQIHFAFEVPREGLDSAVEHVRAQGVEVHGPVRLGWMDSDAYYFFDPDANLLEFWSPDPEARKRVAT